MMRPKPPSRETRLVQTAAEYRREVAAIWLVIILSAVIVGTGAAADLGGWFVP